MNTQEIKVTYECRHDKALETLHVSRKVIASSPLLLTRLKSGDEAGRPLKSLKIKASVVCEIFTTSMKLLSEAAEKNEPETVAALCEKIPVSQLVNVIAFCDYLECTLLTKQLSTQLFQRKSSLSVI